MNWRKSGGKIYRSGHSNAMYGICDYLLRRLHFSPFASKLLQAQRDYFGAHTYERTDKPRGEFFHTNWTGRGGNTASTTYDV